MLLENFQLAKKLYISTGKLTDKDFQEVKKIIDGNEYLIKLICDLYFIDKNSDYKWTVNEWKKCVTQLKNYNKNIFPIKNFSYESSSFTLTKELIRYREKIFQTLDKWPKIYKRNLIEDIRIPRTELQFKKILDTILYIDNHLYYLDNRKEQIKKKIYNKIFSSDHPTFEDVLDFVEDKQNLVYGDAYSIQELFDLVEKNNSELEIVYHKDNIVIVDVMSQSGIKIIGCNSLWCFTYGNEYGRAGEQWDEYSYNSHVYAIINFSKDQNSPEFIHIVTKPVKLLNIPYYDPNQKTFGFFDTIDQNEEYFANTGIFNMHNDELYGSVTQNLNYIVNHDKEALKVFTFKDN